MGNVNEIEAQRGVCHRQESRRVYGLLKPGQGRARVGEDL